MDNSSIEYCDPISPPTSDLRGHYDSLPEVNGSSQWSTIIRLGLRPQWQFLSWDHSLKQIMIMLMINSKCWHLLSSSSQYAFKYFSTGNIFLFETLQLIFWKPGNPAWWPYLNVYAQWQSMMLLPQYLWSPDTGNGIKEFPPKEFYFQTNFPKIHTL